MYMSLKVFVLYTRLKNTELLKKIDLITYLELFCLGNNTILLKFIWKFKVISYISLSSVCTPQTQGGLRIQPVRPYVFFKTQAFPSK